MFTFTRTRSGVAEAWDILIAEGVLENSEERFGRALSYRGASMEGDIRYHEVGNLLVITDPDGVEILLAFKELSETEQRTLDQELELLLGHHVWEGADGPTRGEFIRARLYSQ